MKSENNIYKEGTPQPLFDEQDNALVIAGETKEELRKRKEEENAKQQAAMFEKYGVPKFMQENGNNPEDDKLYTKGDLSYSRGQG